MHIPLGGLFVQTVQFLAVADRSQCCHSQHLCLTTGKQTSAVYTGQNANLSRQRTNLINASAVHTLALIEPCTDDLLLDEVQDLVDHAGLFAANGIESLVCRINDRAQACIPFVLVVGVQSVCHLVMHHCINILEQLLVYLVRLKDKLLLADFCLDVGNKGNHFFDFFMTGKNCLEHGILRHFIGASLDHDDLVLSAGNGQMQVIVLALFQRRVQHDLAVNQSYADAGDRSVPGNIGNGQRNRSGDHAHNIRCAVLVHCQNRHDNGNVIPHGLREQRTNRTVYHTRGQNRLFRGLSFPLGERTGNLSHRIHPFLIVHRQREKVDALSRLCACSDIRHHHGIAVAYPAGTVRQSAGLSGLDRKGSAGKGCFKSLCVLKHILSFLS